MPTFPGKLYCVLDPTKRGFNVNVVENLNLYYRGEMDIADPFWH